MTALEERQKMLKILADNPLPLLHSDLTFSTLCNIYKNSGQEEVTVRLLPSDMIAASAALGFTAASMDDFVNKEHKVEDYL